MIFFTSTKYAWEGLTLAQSKDGCRIIFSMNKYPWHIRNRPPELAKYGLYGNGLECMTHTALAMHPQEKYDAYATYHFAKLLNPRW